MAKVTRKCWLTFEGDCRDEACVWRMSREHPEVRFDIRQASIGDHVGVMAISFSGEDEQVGAALQTLTDLGVRIDPVEGGSLVES